MVTRRDVVIENKERESFVTFKNCRYRIYIEYTCVLLIIIMSNIKL